jgi:hypothetical protein
MVRRSMATLVAALWVVAALSTAPARAFVLDEAATLGTAHAVEHAPAQGLLKRARPTEHAKPTSRIAKLLRDINDDPAVSGKWTTAPFHIPTFAIHAAVLPTGKVIAWGYPSASSVPRPNLGQAFLWDPTKGTGSASLKSIPPPLIDAADDGRPVPAPLYCSGESFLADGQLLLVGGNRRWPDDLYGQDFSALRVAHTFDPWTETWTRQPPPGEARWYPGQVRIADGRTIVLGGYNDLEPGGVYASTLEVYTPAAERGGIGQFQTFPQGARKTALYPHLIAWPNGGALLAGPGQGDSGLLDPVTMTWQKVKAPLRNRVGGTQILLPGGPDGSLRVMQVGGYDPNEERNDAIPATDTTETIDFSKPAPAWTMDSERLNIARSYMNTLVLPTGDVLAVGGGKGKYGALQNYAYRADGAAKHVEIRDYYTGRWRLGAAQQEIRAYHSTAVLLPDGRVWSAGDDYSPNNKRDTAEIYSPPYLFRGPRPKITAAPSQLAYGQTFGVSVAGAGAKRAVLMAPNAMTHATDMEARHVELRISGSPSNPTITAPASAGIAPSGYYMLFVIGDRDVPSVARWVKLG